jgi:3,4-dihydroxy-9,10-secoandrosta-1,3,5(10)-triene-9,17-dione 4,5-dioxygenase
MNIEQLGYLGFNSTDPSALSQYATDTLGMQSVKLDTGRPSFRIDSYEQRVIVEPSEKNGAAYIGWQVADSAVLQAAAGEVEAAGVKVHEATKEELEVRRVADMVHFLDPAGYRVELYCGAATTNEAFNSPRGVPGFVAEDLGLGHCVLATRNLAETQSFYIDVLGFKVSDYMIEAPFSATFLHCNPRHHSLALADANFFNIPNVMHHFLLEIEDEDEVGRAWDHVQKKGVPIGMNIGRHTNDHMFSFYVASPIGVLTEFGAGGRLIDDDTWEVQQMPGPDIWGHGH